MNIIERPSLSSLTTMRLGGTAIAEIRLEGNDDFFRLRETMRSLGGTPYVLGGGSNLLVRDGDLPILVLRPPRALSTPSAAWPEVVAGDQHTVRVRAAAGMPLPRMLAWCIKNGLSGLEGLAGVPGHLGGAIAMNAGAFGCSTAPLVRHLTVFTLENGLHDLPDGSWEYSYRHFALKEPCSWSIIVAAELDLARTSADELRAKAAANLRQKMAGQPVREHSAGCVFKNPEGQSAGRLLDEAGVKGLAKGSFHFSEKHANFLVHDVKSGIPAAFDDAYSLICEAKQRVLDRFGISLSMEVLIWP